MQNDKRLQFRDLLLYACLAAVILMFITRVIDFSNPTVSKEEWRILLNYSIGMSMESCLIANGPPLYEYIGPNPPKLRGFYPDPTRIPTGKVLAYEHGYFCILVYFNANSQCEYIYVAYT